MVEPIEIRFKDDETRPQARRDLLKQIVDYKLAAKSLADPEREAVCVAWMLKKFSMKTFYGAYFELPFGVSRF